ncbi:MAG: tetratricopeptide repeat protein [Acidobacteriota bacterium]
MINQHLATASSRLTGVALLTAALVVQAPSTARAAEFETCWAAYEASRWSEAASCFEELVGEYEGWAWGHHYLGVSLHQSGRKDAALEQFGLAMDAMPSDEDPTFDPFFMAAQILAEKGNYSRGLDVLKRGRDLLSGDQMADFQALTGRMQYGLGNWSEAISAYEESEDRSYDTYYAIGTAYYKLGDLASATDALEQALKKKPGDPSTVSFLRNAYTKRAQSARDDRAQERLWTKTADIGRQLLRNRPNSVEANVMVGQALMGAKDYSGALKYLQAAVRINPGHCESQYNLAQLHANQENWSKAITHANKAIGCRGLDSNVKRNARIIAGDALVVQANRKVGKLADNDSKGRRSAISDYKKALDQFRAAQKVRSSAQVKDKIAAADTTISDLESAIGTIEENQRIDEENQRIEEENRQNEEKMRKLRESRGG